MIPNVTKGADMGGLVRYLVGPGRANEHENPHVVGGDEFAVAWHGNEVLDRGSAAEIAAYLDEPRKVFGTEMRARVSEYDAETGEARAAGWKDQYVWHCSLSVSAADGPLSGEQWDAVTRTFMDEMGFTEASGKAPARWVAIHHGLSKEGNDHVHIAASMVREDGTRWDGRWRDFLHAQEACREIEVAHGLTPVEGRARQTAERGEKPAERATADRDGHELTAAKDLEHRVRAAAVASTSEAEWVRRVRADGVMIKPYFAAGSTDVVSGYRVARRPSRSDQRPVFYGGGRLARDLSLPRVRETWPAPDLAAADAASAEWQAAFRGQSPVTQGREARAAAATAPEVAAGHLAAFNDRLTGAAGSDQMVWSDAARDVSGALSAWAKHDPDNAVELRRAAAVLARSAQTRRAGVTPGRRVAQSPMGTAFVLLAARRDDRPSIPGAVLMRQLLKTAQALADHHRAAGDLRQAAALQRDAVDRLQRVQLRGYAIAPPEQMSEVDQQAWRAHQVANQGRRTTAEPVVEAAPAPAGKPSVEGVRGPLPARLTPPDRTAAGGARQTGERDGSRG